jgi:hypothetical protein
MNMPRKNTSPSSAESTPSTTDEADFLARALDYYRAVKRAGKEAPFGQFLNHAEAAVEKEGQNLLRQSLESITQEAADEIKKKTKQYSVRPVNKKCDIADSPQNG